MPNIVQGSPTAGPLASVLVPNNGQLDQNFMAMVPLYTGGGLGSKVRTAESLAAAATSGIRTSELDVALSARVAYRQVRLNQAIVEAWKRRVDESKERVRIAEAAFKEGRIAKYDLLRNQTELAESEQALNNAIRDVDVALVNLKRVMGISQTSEISLTSELTFEPITETLESAQAQALAQRPEVSAARARVQAAQAQLAVAKSLYRPQVYGVAMQDFVSASEMGSDQGFTVGIAASLPVFDAGLRRSQVTEAQSMLERMRAEERDVVLAVAQDVGTAFSELQAAARNVELARVAVEQAEEDYRVIKLRYESGKAINVEVLDALFALTRAQTNYAQALFDYNVAGDRLARAKGSV